MASTTDRGAGHTARRPGRRTSPVIPGCAAVLLATAAAVPSPPAHLGAGGAGAAPATAGAPSAPTPVQLAAAGLPAAAGSPGLPTGTPGAAGIDGLLAAAAATGTTDAATVPDAVWAALLAESPSPRERLSAAELDSLMPGGGTGALAFVPTSGGQGADGTPGPRSGGSGTAGIPARAHASYVAAAERAARTTPGCGLTWHVLAGIGRVESNHGRYGGAVVGPDGRSAPEIIGIPLDGRPGVALIRDSDGGRMDRDTTYDRAVGPMQFIPTTWAGMGVDGDGDGTADPHDLDDAAAAAARYLCAGGTDMRDPEGARRAVHRYNHSWDYVDQVLALARQYAADPGAVVADGPAGTTSPPGGRTGGAPSPVTPTSPGGAVVAAPARTTTPATRPPATTAPAPAGTTARPPAPRTTAPPSAPRPPATTAAPRPTTAAPTSPVTPPPPATTARPTPSAPAPVSPSQAPPAPTQAPPSSAAPPPPPPPPPPPDPDPEPDPGPVVLGTVVLQPAGTVSLDHLDLDPTGGQHLLDVTALGGPSGLALGVEVLPDGTTSLTVGTATLLVVVLEGTLDPADLVG